MSTNDDDQPLTKDETLRRMERDRARLEADIKHSRDDLRATEGNPPLRRAAGDWRRADESGHNEEDEKRG